MTVGVVAVNIIVIILPVFRTGIVRRIYINAIDFPRIEVFQELQGMIVIYIAPIERSAKLRESSERRDYGHEKTMDRQGKARDSA